MLSNLRAFLLITAAAGALALAVPGTAAEPARAGDVNAREADGSTLCSGPSISVTLPKCSGC